MSRTKRIYNRRLKKAQRFNWDAPPIKNEIGIIINNNIVGIPYTRKSFICMGRCSICRDPNKEPRLIRKRLKEQFRFDLKNELKPKEEKEHCDFPIIWNTMRQYASDATICKWCLGCGQ